MDKDERGGKRAKGGKRIESRGATDARMTQEQEEREYKDYITNHPAYADYKRIDALEAEMEKIIDAKTGVDDTRGDERMDEIEAELTTLGRYDDYFETKRSRVIGTIRQEYLSTHGPTAQYVSKPTKAQRSRSKSDVG